MPTVTEKKPEPARRRGRYPKEFRRDEAALVIDQHRTVADVAREMELIEQTVGNWARQERVRPGRARRAHHRGARGARQASPGEPSAAHRERPAEKSNSLLGEGVGPVSRYRWIDSRKAEGFPVAAACRTAGVSASAYYGWRDKVTGGPTQAEWDEAIVVNEMYDVHRHLDDTYGSPRMTDELRRRGHGVNHKRTERLMATNGIYAKDGRRKKVRMTIPDVSAPPLADLVTRDFSVGKPGERTCGDITYIPTDEGWLYLADVLDLGSRRIVGFAMADHMPTELIASAMAMASGARGGDVDGMIFHHDGGVSTSRGSSGVCASATASPSRQEEPVRVTTTPWRSHSGHRSSESWYRVTASPPGPTAGGPSSPGSTTTTPCGCTARSAMSRPSSGSYASPTATCWPHNHVSG